MKKEININFRLTKNYLSIFSLNLTYLFGDRLLTKGALFFNQIKFLS